VARTPPTVASYLALNVVVIGVGMWQVISEPHVIGDWSDALTTEHGNPFMSTSPAGSPR
jgi:hypothetical protein